MCTGHKDDKVNILESGFALILVQVGGSLIKKAASNYIIWIAQVTSTNRRNGN